jgi:hypothetical protein
MDATESAIVGNVAIAALTLAIDAFLSRYAIPDAIRKVSSITIAAGVYTYYVDDIVRNTIRDMQPEPVPVYACICDGSACGFSTTDNIPHDIYHL